MEKEYKNPALPGSLGGIDKFAHEYRHRGNKVSDKEVKKTLEHVDSYSIYKQAKKKFLTRPVVTITIDHIWDVDLLSIPADLVEHNDGYTFILGAIDIFSRYAFAVPVKSKQATVVLQGFKTLLKTTTRSPHSVRTDFGREFVNKLFDKYLDDQNIKHIHNHTLHKANYIERFFRTIKVKFHKYMHEANTKKFIDKLPDFISAYNNTYHRGIKARPSAVNYENELKFYKAQKERGENHIDKKLRFKFNIGDQVRISHLSRPFKRSYDQSFTPEIFEITKRYKRQGIPIYEIKNCAGEIEGKFYTEELTLVRIKADATWPIDKIFRNKKKKIDGVIHYLVSWRNYPLSCASYVPETDLVDI